MNRCFESKNQEKSFFFDILIGTKLFESLVRISEPRNKSPESLIWNNQSRNNTFVSVIRNSELGNSLTDSLIRISEPRNTFFGLLIRNINKEPVVALIFESLALTRFSEYSKIPSLKTWHSNYTMKTVLNEIRRQMCDKSQFKLKQPPEGASFM